MCDLSHRWKWYGVGEGKDNREVVRERGTEDVEEIEEVEEARVWERAIPRIMLTVV